MRTKSYCLTAQSGTILVGRMVEGSLEFVQHPTPMNLIMRMDGRLVAISGQRQCLIQTTPMEAARIERERAEKQLCREQNDTDYHRMFFPLHTSPSEYAHFPNTIIGGIECAWHLLADANVEPVQRAMSCEDVDGAMSVMGEAGFNPLNTVSVLDETTDSEKWTAAYRVLEDAMVKPIKDQAKDLVDRRYGWGKYAKKDENIRQPTPPPAAQSESCQCRNTRLVCRIFGCPRDSQ